MTQTDTGGIPPAEKEHIRKGVSARARDVLLLVQCLEAMHRSILKLAEEDRVDIDEQNDLVRSLLSQLVEGSDGTS